MKHDNTLNDLNRLLSDTIKRFEIIIKSKKMTLKEQWVYNNLISKFKTILYQALIKTMKLEYIKNRKKPD